MLSRRIAAYCTEINRVLSRSEKRQSFFERGLCAIVTQRGLCDQTPAEVTAGDGDGYLMIDLHRIDLHGTESDRFGAGHPFLRKINFSRTRRFPLTTVVRPTRIDLSCLCVHADWDLSRMYPFHLSHAQSLPPSACRREFFFDGITANESRSAACGRHAERACDFRSEPGFRAQSDRACRCVGLFLFATVEKPVRNSDDCVQFSASVRGMIMRATGKFLSARCLRGRS